MTGSLRVHRKLILNNALYDNESVGRWIKLLLSAYGVDTEKEVGGKIFKLKAGQCVKTAKDWGELFGLAESAVIRYFRFLEERGMITMEACGKYHSPIIITILNWAKYQQVNNIDNECCERDERVVAPKKVDNLEEKAKQVIDHLNKVANKPRGFTYRADYISPIKTLLRSKWGDMKITVDLIKLVVEYKVEKWRGDDFNEKYIRPQTLFAKKNFLKYCDEVYGDDEDFTKRKDLEHNQVLTVEILNEFDKNSMIFCSKNGEEAREFLVSDVLKSVKLKLSEYRFCKS